MDSKECTKCIHKCVCKTAESCDGYVSGCEHFREEQKHTEADRIRALSDEELARELAYHEYTVAKAVLEAFGVDITKLGYDIEVVVAELLERIQQPCGADMRGEEDGND